MHVHTIFTKRNQMYIWAWWYKPLLTLRGQKQVRLWVQLGLHGEILSPEKKKKKKKTPSVVGCAYKWLRQEDSHIMTQRLYLYRSFKNYSWTEIHLFWPDYHGLDYFPVPCLVTCHLSLSLAPPAPTSPHEASLMTPFLISAPHL